MSTYGTSKAMMISHWALKGLRPRIWVCRYFRFIPSVRRRLWVLQEQERITLRHMETLGPKRKPVAPGEIIDIAEAIKEARRGLNDSNPYGWAP